jgi:hypothetical protein
MPHIAEQINAAVAIRNTSKVNLTMQYAGQPFTYPCSGKVKIVPYAVGMHHFGFELGPHGGIIRQSADKRDDGTETPYHAARASFLPWGWQHDETPVDKRTKPDGSLYNPTLRKDEFEKIRDAWENHISAKLVSMPREMSESQFESLPA